MNGPERDDEPRIDELETLPRELEPPPELERRVVDALRARGLVAAGKARPGRRAPRWAALAAASLLAFTAGWFGRTLAIEPGPIEQAAAEDPRPRFLLLLSEPGAGRELSPDELAARIAEYRTWAHGLADRGLLEGADRLEPQAVRLDGGTGEPDPAAGTGAAAGEPAAISGFFVVRAEDLEQARRIAETCPHLRHGGRVTLRPIAG